MQEEDFDEIQVEIASVVYNNPDDSEPEFETESVWEEPDWESIVDNTISSVVLPAQGWWNIAIYTLSNGKMIFATKGLNVGDSPLDYQVIRTLDGGYFSDPGGVVGHTSANHIDGGALIIKQGESFLRQKYVWSNNSEPVMSPTTSDVTKQIGSIEVQQQADMNGDGFLGAPVEDENEIEIEIEITAVVYDNPDGIFNRAIYKMTDGSVSEAEQGLSIGDLPYKGYNQLRAKDGSPIETVGVVGALWHNGDLAVVYNNGGIVTQQIFRWGNNGWAGGQIRDISRQINIIEETQNIDINKDGRIGKQDAEVQSIVYDNPYADFDWSIYKMTDGTVRLAEQGLSAGDLPFEGDEMSGKGGSPIETVGLVGAIWLNNGLGIIYNNGGVITQQQYKWGGRGIKASGKLRNITKQLEFIEEREGVDFNGDGQIGEQFDEDAEVQTVLFNPDPDNWLNRSLYKLTNGELVIAEVGLQPGEMPFEAGNLSNVDGTPVEADNVVGLIGTKRGEAVIFKEGDNYSIQEYKWAGQGLKPRGKERDITRRIYEVEDRENFDFTGDSIIGEPSSGKDPEVRRVIFSGNDEFNEGLYQMNSGDLVFAEPDLVPGDTPFEDEIITGKDRQSYPGDYVVGIYPIKNGFALVENVEGRYYQQGFRFKGNGRPKPFGKARAVKDIGKIESKYGFDLDNDGSIFGSNDVDYLVPAFRLIQQLDSNNISGSIA